MNAKIQPYVAPGEGENISVDAFNVFGSQLATLGFSLTGVFAISTKLAGERTPIDELIKLGLKSDDEIFINYTLAGHDNTYAAAPGAKILADGNTSAVMAFIQAQFQGEPGADATSMTLSAITGIPAVQAALKKALGA
jgi:hypothetical protein